MLFSVTFIVFSFVFSVSSESCYYQRCLGCRAHESERLHTVQCDPSNWVSAEWVHNLVAHPPPSTASRVPIEYRCLKMVATPDDKSFGNTVDILRGCVPRAQVDSVCLSLVAVERSRGHSNARCFTCRGNDCNSAPKLTSNTSVFLSIALIILNFVYR